MQIQMKRKRKKIKTSYRKNRIHRFTNFTSLNIFQREKNIHFRFSQSISQRQLISSSFSLAAILHSNANENKNTGKNSRKCSSRVLFISHPPLLFVSRQKKKRKKKDEYHNLPFNQSHKHNLS